MIEKNEFLFQLWLLQLVSVCRGRFTECLVFFFKVILAFFTIFFLSQRWIKNWVNYCLGRQCLKFFEFKDFIYCSK